jgi:hypothetical protein
MGSRNQEAACEFEHVSGRSNEMTICQGLNHTHSWVFDKAQSEVGPNASMAHGPLLITQKNPHVRIEMFG